MSRIYDVHIQIKDKIGYTIYTNSFYEYSLTEAIKKGKQDLLEYYKSIIGTFPSRLRKISFDDYMQNLDYYFFINIISGNRMRFNSYNELKEYFNNNIINIPNNNLYDFLLSLIDHMYSSYDYNGNLLESEGFFNDKNSPSVYDIKFDEEGCSRGEYIFSI